MDINEIFKYIGEMYVQSKAEVSALRDEIARLNEVIRNLQNGQSGAGIIPPDER